MNGELRPRKCRKVLWCLLPIPTSPCGGCANFFAAAELKFGPIDSIGFACVGPLDLRTESPTYGHMLATPKFGWSRANLLDPLQFRCGVPIAIDTDVAAAALLHWLSGDSV